MSVFLNSAGDVLTVFLDTNGGNKAVTVTRAINITSNEFGNCVIAGPYSLGAGKIQEVACSLSPGGMPSGEKVKIQLYLNYKKLGGSYNTPIQGEIYGTVG